ncbi:MAG: protein kinase [Nostoc sp. DcaGUA01]|nr:protein kinase [Nostoc sp. DedQUE11]MDZ8079494.1 protein kinase [Nostoc sp. DcaGUA01]
MIKLLPVNAMSLCINPHCPNPQNRDDELFCLSCGSELLLQGRYRVLHHLGGGGFAVTFEVNEVRNNIPKVLKVLINNQQKAIELFQREAEVLAKLNHPGIPKVERDAYFVYFPRNSKNPIHCLVMEKIVGIDLQKYMENRGMRVIDKNLAIQWLRELVTILHQVHNQNFFHRDIKPPNIMLRATGELALIDFGTAREVTQTYHFAQGQGQVTGIVSAGYTPVEQMNGQAVPQSDFFALGRTFVYLLTGKQPLDSEIYNHHNDELRWRNQAPHILQPLADLLDEMMAHRPYQRPANTEVILQRLAEIDISLNSPPVRPPLLANTFAGIPTQVKSTSGSPTLLRAKVQITVSERNFWVRWVLANIISGTLVSMVLYFSGEANPNVGVLWFIGSLLAALVGTMQWLVLRQKVYQAASWILGTTAGFAVGAVVSYAVTYNWSENNRHAIAFLGAIIVASVGQWLVLRQHVHKAGWWMLTTPISFTVGLFVMVLAIGFLGSVLGYSANIYTLVFVIAVLDAVFGALTGVVLVRLLRHPISKI